MQPKYKPGQRIIADNGEKGVIIGRSKDFTNGAYIYIVQHENFFNFDGKSPYSEIKDWNRFVWGESYIKPFVED